MTERPDVKYNGFVPPKGEYRRWTDNTGRYNVEALFVSLQGDQVMLHSNYYGTVVLPMNRLSDKDQRWVRRQSSKPPPEKKVDVPDMTQRPDAARRKGDPVIPRMTQRPDAARKAKVVNLYTIYNKNTSDYPGVMVMRRWEVSGSLTAPKMEPKEVVWKGDTIEEMRSKLPKGCINLGRFAPEDPNIVESWMETKR